MEMPVFAEKNHADFVRIDVERHAEHIAGEPTSSSKPTSGSPDTLAMPVAMLVIVPTSRGDSCGVNASRTWLIPANVLSKTSCKLSGSVIIGASFRAWALQIWISSDLDPRRGFRFGLGFGFRFRLGLDFRFRFVFLFQKLTDALFQ